MDPVAGWKSRSQEWLDVQKCPACRHTDQIFGDDDGISCPDCGGKFPITQWTTGRAKKHVAVCADCDESIPLTSANLAGSGYYVCSNPKCCQNIVAVRVGSRAIHPQSVLKVEWAKSLRRRSRRLADSSYRVAEVKSQTEYLVARLLCRYAKAEESSFRCWGEQAGNLVLVCMDRKRYMGYVYSTRDDDGTPVLRQIFIGQEHRGRGLGMILVRHWAETYAFPQVEKFGVESPNHKSLGILERLGYIRSDGDGVVGVRCSIFSDG